VFFATTEGKIAMNDTGMGRRIRSRRTQLGIGLRELARRAQIEPSQLSKIERGLSQEIRTDTLRRLTYHLGVTADWLLGPYEEESEAESDTLAAAV
jgi:transcriptional regulator with XRE-family HTH domain